MAAVMRILSYLKGAPGKWLIFRKHGYMEIKGYTDVDWAGNITDRRVTSRYFTFVAGNLVTWRSKKGPRQRQSIGVWCMGFANYCG